MREQFHLPQSPYFLSHSVGCLPKCAEFSLTDNVLSAWKTQGGDAWPIWLTTIEKFATELSQLLGGKPSDYCPQTNLSSGLGKYLGALPKPSASKNKILMHADAFPSMGFVVEQCAKLGFALKLIETQHPAHEIASWQGHITEDVVGVLITHVHSNTGCVSPVKSIIDMAKANQSVTLVDIAQSAGILPIDVNSWRADIVLGSCVKWLCGGSGAGFMWINPNTIETLEPIDVGWFSHDNPFEMDIRNFNYHKQAKRFWGGTPSVAPYAIALGSLRLINSIGVENILRHNRHLTTALLAKAPTSYQTLTDNNERGGTLCLGFSEPSLSQIEQNLKRQQMFYDRRKHTLRFSFHIFNTDEEVEQLSELLWGSVAKK